MTNSQEKANQTIEHMGGIRKLSFMVGAFNFVSDEKGTLTFRFKGSRKFNFCRVEIVSDLYQVTFGKVSNYGMTWKDLSTAKDVFNDKLIEAFEKTTSLYLTI